MLRRATKVNCDFYITLVKLLSSHIKAHCHKYHCVSLFSASSVNGYNVKRKLFMHEFKAYSGHHSLYLRGKHHFFKVYVTSKPLFVLIAAFLFIYFFAKALTGFLFHGDQSNFYTSCLEMQRSLVCSVAYI